MQLQKKIIIQSIIALLAIICTQLFPEFVLNTRYVFLALVILLIGMPHGALDHFIDGKIEKWNPLSFNLKFYGWYIFYMTLYSVIWIIFPFWSFMFFLIITLYHFGQADAERFNYQGWRKLAIHLSRGVTVVGLIVYGDLSYASSIIHAVTDVSIIEYSESFADQDTIKWGIACIYPITFLIVYFSQKRTGYRLPVYLLDAVIVSLLFIYTDPVWAFAIYFGLWHSFNHVLVMLNFLREETREYGFGWFYKQSFIFSLLSYVGLLIIYNSLNAFGNEELMVSLLFVIISILTLPHMMVVEKMYLNIGQKKR